MKENPSCQHQCILFSLAPQPVYLSLRSSTHVFPANVRLADPIPQLNPPAPSRLLSFTEVCPAPAGPLNPSGFLSLPPTSSSAYLSRLYTTSASQRASSTLRGAPPVLPFRCVRASLRPRPASLWWLGGYSWCSVFPTCRGDGRGADMTLKLTPTSTAATVAGPIGEVGILFAGRGN